jgi:hypothetical protein
MRYDCLGNLKPINVPQASMKYECLGNLKYDLLLIFLNVVIFDVIGILWVAFLCDEMMIYEWVDHDELLLLYFQGDLPWSCSTGVLQMSPACQTMDETYARHVELRNTSTNYKWI